MSADVLIAASCCEYAEAADLDCDGRVTALDA